MDGRVLLDQDGTELAGPDEVRHEAIRAAGEMLANGEASGMLDGHSWNMTVADEDSKTVMTLCIKIEAYS